MSVRDISEHLSTLYGTEIGRDTISRVTDAVLQDIAAWRSRPLEHLYPIAYFDALMVKVREDRSVKTRACYLAIGVTMGTTTRPRIRQAQAAPSSRGLISPTLPLSNRRASA